MAHPPTRRYEVGIKLSADTWEALEAEIQLIATKLALADPGPIDSVTGGPASSHSLVVLEDPERSPEGFQSALLAWRAARLREKASEVGK